MEKIKLTDICNPKQWKTIPTSELLEDGYPVYGANGIIGYYSEFNHKNPVITVTCRGATCGTINITVPKSYVTGNAMCLDDVRSDIYMEYLYYCLKHYNFNNVISGSAQPQITRQGMEKIYVTIGSHNEQMDIVDKLKKVENVIGLKKQELKQLDTFVKSRFVEMFGDPVANDKEWTTLPLEEACKTIVDCPHSTPSYTTENTGFMCIRTSIVKKNKILWDDIEYIPEDEFIKSPGAYPAAPARSGPHGRSRPPAARCRCNPRCRCRPRRSGWQRLRRFRHQPWPRSGGYRSIP